jgi:tRNA-dihydrouridine synthase 1
MSKKHGWEFWQSIGAPKFICAPMVDGSELPFRMMTRSHGVTLAYTPMLHSKNFSDSAKFRSQHFTTCPEDRPVFAQFCANDPQLLLAAARHVQDQVDAVDINFGCPQGIAKKGHYGSFLLEEPDLICSLVRILHENLDVPVTAKIRLLPKLEDTISLAKRIQEAGASVLTVHGRTKEMKKQLVGVADWNAIKAIREAVTIPVISNGNIRCLADVEECLKFTGCAGVMSAEGLLANPTLFTGKIHRPIDMSMELMQYLEKYPVHPGITKGHLFWILNPTGILATHIDLRSRLQKSTTREEYMEVLTELRQRIDNTPLLENAENVPQDTDESSPPEKKIRTEENLPNEACQFDAPAV